MWRKNVAPPVLLKQKRIRVDSSRGFQEVTPTVICFDDQSESILFSGESHSRNRSWLTTFFPSSLSALPHLPPAVSPLFAPPSSVIPETSVPRLQPCSDNQLTLFRAFRAPRVAFKGSERFIWNSPMFCWCFWFLTLWFVRWRWVQQRSRRKAELFQTRRDSSDTEIHVKPKHLATKKLDKNRDILSLKPNLFT